MKQLKVLELFAGTRSIGKEFEKRGHLVYSVEWNKDFEDIDWNEDIGKIKAQDIIDRFGVPDVIWCSPDCTSYSIAAISHHRTKEEDGNLAPKSDYAKFCDTVNKNVMKLIEDLSPTYYFIENPRGGMRKMNFIKDKPRHTVTYCQYGDKRMKPTDIWTNHPNPKFKPMCKNGDPCHVKAPRGSKTGTQGLKNAKERSVIPQQLCEHISKIAEDGFADVVNLENIKNKIIEYIEINSSEGNFILDISQIENTYNIQINKNIKKEIVKLLESDSRVIEVIENDTNLDILISN